MQCVCFLVIHWVSQSHPVYQSVLTEEHTIVSVVIYRLTVWMGVALRTIRGRCQVEAEQVIGSGAVLPVTHDQFSALAAAVAVIIMTAAFRLQLPFPHLQLWVPHFLLLFQHHSTLRNRRTLHTYTRDRAEQTRKKKGEEKFKCRM